MKKMFLMVMLLVTTTAFAGGGDDESDYQYFVACGQLYKTDANVSGNDIADLIEKLEEDCEQSEDKEDVEFNG